MTPLHELRKWWRTHKHRRAGEAGFTIVETTVAMALVFLVLTGTLATFSASVRNVVGGRQRTGAVALARSVIEDARASLYDQVGHDVGGDPTFADDPAVTGSPKTYGGEELVGSANPLWPEHRFTATHDATTYTVLVYVTWTVNGTADPFKRLTVITSWDDPNAGVMSEVRLSSFLFFADVPPDPMVSGRSDVDGGTVTVTGTLDGVDLSRAVIFNPTAAGDIESLFIREASGKARSSSALLEMNTGTPSGCSVSAATAQCDGIVADTTADSDTSTQSPENDAEGPTYDTSHTLSGGTGFNMNLGANDSVESKSSGRSCFTCFSPTIGDDDRLAYDRSQGSGPDSASIGITAGPVTANLIEVSGASHATSTLDQDAVSSSHLLTSKGRFQMPGIDVVTVDGAPSGFVAAVRISSVDVEVTSQAGPTAAAPAVTGGDVTVDIYDTLSGGTLGYRQMVITPGEAKEDSASASYPVEGTDADVALTTTVISGGKSLAHTTDSGGTINYGEASLTNWLRITVQIVVTSGTGETLADLTVEFDYGRLASRAQWESV